MFSLEKLVTIIIVSYKSKNKLISILKLIPKKIKVIIIENSYDYKLKILFEKKFNNTKIILRKNIGYGNAINFASNYVKTKYFYALNPDVQIYKSTIKNLLNQAILLKDNFGVIGPVNKKSNILRKNNKKIILLPTKLINGSAMFFNKKNFKNIKGFDKNIFLYFEENDICKKFEKKKIKMYYVLNSFIKHQGGLSSSNQNNGDNYKIKLTAAWHGQWSKYYYYKKHYGFFYAQIKCQPRLIKIIIQIILTKITLSNKFQIYLFQLKGILNSMFGFKSYIRPENIKLYPLVK
jgi:N-acetylglucosaminyl-diphospho-decaprenol L-rhamnosyltransferase